ncbi:hypothetical protein POVCU2_0029400 [Plasmodium ovale curtisi]|uniref:Uncharacterized protein n=1 Tax=Plasmodium ovale curtisi TaxID=864141 RepID=A0A1A8W1M5_PLAOA|nr:hypothetical protein POVCU2_0029400 [Plasmodium ovale curtisi]
MGKKGRTPDYTKKVRGRGGGGEEFTSMRSQNITRRKGAMWIFLTKWACYVPLPSTINGKEQLMDSYRYSEKRFTVNTFPLFKKSSYEQENG